MQVFFILPLSQQIYKNNYHKLKTCLIFMKVKVVQQQTLFIQLQLNNLYSQIEKPRIMQAQNPQFQPENQSQTEKLIDQDPFGPSYHQSAIKHLPYRIGILVFAGVMIVVGKSNLPTDQVPCIQDAVLDWLQPVTNFYLSNEAFGLALVSIMQLLVDIQLVAMLFYWFFYGQSMRYPLILGIIGISKILLNVLFQTKQIDKSFNQQLIPSIVFGSNFVNTYFFSGVCCLLMTHLLELYEQKKLIMFKLQLVVMFYVIFVLLSARQNFFMDICTALVFTHLVFYFINHRITEIDRLTFKIYDKIVGNKQEQIKEPSQI